MAKQALAVTYRPKTFEDVCEQKSTTTVLKQQIETKSFQHSYLFCGPAGCGKTTLSRIFANDLNNGKGSPIEIDAASNNGVEQIRELIENAKRKSLDSEYKVFILDECHMLSNSSWNALLKLLEEPPKFSIFIMATTDPQKIPATIISRVQRYNFSKISTPTIVARLHYILKLEHISTVDDEAVHFIAKLANGGMRDAITMLDKCLSLTKELTINSVADTLGIADNFMQFKLLQSLTTYDVKSCTEVLEEVFRDGKDLKIFISSFLTFLIDCAKYKLFNSFDYLQIPPTTENKAQLQDLQLKEVLRVVDFINETNAAIKWESNPLYAIEAMLLGYCKGGQLDD